MNQKEFRAVTLILDRREEKNVWIGLALLGHKYSIFACLMEWRPSLQFSEVRQCIQTWVTTFHRRCSNPLG